MSAAGASPVRGFRGDEGASADASRGPRLWVEPAIGSVGELFAELDRLQGPIAVDRIARVLERVDFASVDLSPWMRFDARTYERNLLRAGDEWHALLMCWRPGQRSAIHDHRGSGCVFRVIDGEATESTFARSSTGLVYPTGSRKLPAGSICGSADDDIHQISNLGDADLLTLHIYSPPLLVMGRYSLTEQSIREFVAPVFEFSAGGGI